MTAIAGLTLDEVSDELLGSACVAYEQHYNMHQAS